MDRREMPMDIMDRDQTMDFLRRHVKTEMLMKHLIAVDAVAAQK
jgi:predicted hydrolase (HD superfamily)